MRMNPGMSPSLALTIAELLRFVCIYQGTLHARQKTAAIVRTKEVMHKLFSTMAQRYQERNGGYCRVLRTRIRPDDSAQMAFIE